MSHGSRGFCRVEIGQEGSRETRLETASGILLEFQAGIPGVGLAGLEGGWMLGRTGGRFWRAQGEGFGELRMMDPSLPALLYPGACKKMCCSWIIFHFIYVLYRICFILVYDTGIYLLIFIVNIWLKAGALLNTLSLLCPSQGNLKDDKTRGNTT